PHRRDLKRLMLRQSLLIGTSVCCDGIVSPVPAFSCAPSVANASSLRVITASIAAPMRGEPTSAAFLFRALCGLFPSRPYLCNNSTVLLSNQRFLPVTLDV